jgi:colanic acid biosynthesis glycosyl transferase WcaI
MKILAISQVYFPDTASTAQHLTDLLEALANNGHVVTVFTSRRKYEDPKILFSKKEKQKNVNIFRIKNTGFGKINKLTRLCDFISFNLLISFKLLLINTKDYDLILGMTSPPLLSYIGIKIAKIKKLKFVYWTMDLQPELSFVAKYLKANSITAQLLQKLGDFIFLHANKIIVLDTYMQKHISKRLNYTKKEIDIIPVWPVMYKVYHGSRLDNPFRIKYGFKDKIVVMYSGNHSVMHPLTTLLEAAVSLKNDDRFLFVHIGGGTRLQEIKDYKTKYNLGNILILPYQPREIIHESLGSADIQVVSLGNDCVGYTHPNKIYGAMFIGKPILYIGPKKSHITDILDKCEGNIAVQHDEIEILVGKLLNFSQLAENQSSDIGLKNKKYAEEHFHPSVLITQMIKSINST